MADKEKVAPRTQVVATTQILAGDVIAREGEVLKGPAKELDALIAAGHARREDVPADDEPAGKGV